MMTLRSEPRFLLMEPEAFEQMILEAARTIVRLPAAGPRKSGSGWPDWLRDADLAYGYNEIQPRVGPPSSREIDRLDRVIDILWRAEPADARLVMVCAFSAQRRGQPKLRGIAWSRVSKLLGWHRDTVKGRYFGALERLRVLAGG